MSRTTRRRGPHSRAELLEPRRLLADAPPFYYPGEVDPAFASVGFNGIVADLARTAAGHYLALVDQPALRRFLADGQPDASFGTNGWAGLFPGGAPRGVGVRPDGRIYVISAYGQAPNGEVLIHRLNPDGTPDAGFGNGGWRVDAAGLGLLEVVDAHFYADGSFVVGDRTGRVLRYDADGTRDAQFGTNGVAVAPFGGGGAARDLVVQPDGAIVLAGNASSGEHNVWRVARFTADGTPDASFDGDGVVDVDVPGTWDQLSRAAFQAPGALVLAGSSRDPDQVHTSKLARLTQTGATDPTFGTGSGFATVASFGAAVHDVAADPSGRIVVGIQWLSSHSAQATLYRFMPHGAPDVSFGDGGRVRQFASHRAIVFEPAGNGDFVSVMAESRLVRYFGAPSGPGPVYLAPGGALRVTGKIYADTVALDVDGNELVVTLNGVATAVAAADVGAVDVLLRGGSDALTIDVGDAFDAPITADGAAGIETYRVAAAPLAREITLFGGESDDRLVVEPDASASVYFDGGTFGGSIAQHAELLCGDGDDVVTVTPDRMSGAGSVIRSNTAFRVSLGGGDDRVEVRGDYVGPVTGGDGDDAVHVYEGVAQYFQGGAGNDVGVIHGTDDADQFGSSSSAIGVADVSAVRDPDCERVVVRAGDGNDSFQFYGLPLHRASNGGAGAEVEVFGGGGTESFQIDAEPTWYSVPLRLFGEAGDDVIYIDGDGNAAADVATINATSAGAAVGDTLFAPGGALYYDDVKMLTLLTSPATDRVRVRPSVTTTFEVFGGAPASAPGDQLAVDVVDADGASHTVTGAGSGVVTFADREPVRYAGIESAAIVEGPRAVEVRFDVEPVQSLAFRFGGALQSAPAPASLHLRNLTSGLLVPAADVAVALDPAGDTVRFTFPGFPYGALADGIYRATLRAGSVTDAAGNPLTAELMVDFFFLQADANRDRRVDLADFNLLAANFGQSDRTFTQGDFNYDGTVDLQDFNLLAGRFGQHVGPRAAARTDDKSGGEDPGDEKDPLGDLLA